MGEVYRADDLTLDQPVALKFLPAGVAVDDARLAQFHNELRIARRSRTRMSSGSTTSATPTAAAS